MSTMLAQVTPNASTTAVPQRQHILRRMAALSRAESILLLRNRTVLLNALLLSPLMAVAMAPMLMEAVGAQSFATLLLQMLILFGLMFVIYYNVTSIVVARREAGIFQRMKTGQASEWEALVCSIIPSGVVLIIQAILGLIAVSFLGGSFPLGNPVALLIAIVGGIVIFAALGAWTSSWTSTVEAAQYSAMPIMMAALFFSGYFLPVQFMPETLQTMSVYSPLYAVNALVGISMGQAPALDGGQLLGAAESYTAMLQPALTVSAWCALSIMAARRTRFERRA